MNIYRKASLIVIIGSITLFTSCKNAQEKQYEELVQIENSLFGEQTELNDSIARLFLQKADLYSKEFKNDPKTAEIVFKQGEVLNGLKSYEYAIRKFQQVFLVYPKSNKAAESIFLCGFIYDTYLQNYEEAGNYYRKFIRLYPNHTFVKDAKTSLENLGKTPEELVKEFELKNKTVN
jgi:tetratricopeptide (TPR) repeat protein